MIRTTEKIFFVKKYSPLFYDRTIHSMMIVSMHHFILSCLFGDSVISQLFAIRLPARFLMGGPGMHHNMSGNPARPFSLCSDETWYFNRSFVAGCYVPTESTCITIILKVIFRLLGSSVLLYNIAIKIESEAEEQETHSRNFKNVELALSRYSFRIFL